MLDEAERMLFQQLGVFVGGWTLDAAERVCGLGGSAELGVLEGMSRLLDQSLIQRAEGSDGGSRFTMLETIRDYALDRSKASGEAEALRQQHAAYFLWLAEAAEPHLSASDQRLWLDRLERDHDNLRAALAWAIDHDPEIALRLAAALTGFWISRGHLGEGRGWLVRALARAGTPAPGTSARAKALHCAGMLAHTQEDDVSAEALYAASLTIARELGDQRRVAILLNALGEMALHRGDSQQAMTLSMEGLALARAVDDQPAIARLLVGLGDVARTRGDLPSARDYMNEGLTILRTLDDSRGMAWALNALGQQAQAAGMHNRAAELFAQGLALARAVGDQEVTLWLLYDTGRLLLEQHDPAGAAARFAQSARLSHALGLRLGVR